MKKLAIVLAGLHEVGPDEFVLDVGAHRRTMRVLQRTANPLEDFLEVERADIRPQDKQADDEPGVAHAVRDKGLVGRIRRTLPFVIKADQQIRADADELPAQEDLEEVIRQDQIEHRKTEKGEEQKEPSKAPAPMQMIRPQHRILFAPVLTEEDAERIRASQSHT